jgi:hypothetical protein
MYEHFEFTGMGLYMSLKLSVFASVCLTKWTDRTRARLHFALWLTELER